jgi:hypothetical protein
MDCGFGVALEIEVIIVKIKAMGLFYSHGFFV